MSLLDKYRLFPTETKSRDTALELYDQIKTLPIISPHGHTDPAWFAHNQAFSDPAQLLVTPDHYAFRMLASHGISPSELGVQTLDGSPYETDSRKIWERFAKHYYLFRGTPSSLWMDYVFENVFNLDVPLNEHTADEYYETIDECLKQENYRPRALFERFNIEVLSTTEGALDDLKWHRAIVESEWAGRVVTAYRPDEVVDPEDPNFRHNLVRLGEISGHDTQSWQGYLDAHRQRRAHFIAHGATSTDHGHKSARTENLTNAQAQTLFEKLLSGRVSAEEADLFRGQMLTEMAKMSLDDGLVMQIHPGCYRDHSPAMHAQYGKNVGFDIPLKTDFVNNLAPLLQAYGHEPDLRIILFTLDETTLSRELAPLAGAYSSLRLGPAWWFYDSPEGMQRFRQLTTETAGFYNTAGFNDDTRAFCSIPARHDVARRVDCAYLSTLVNSGRLSLNDAKIIAVDLTYTLAKQAYKL